MRLSPRDIDKLMLHQAGFLSQKRYWRGTALNYPEAIALIASQLLEFIRDGKDVPTLMDLGKQILGIRDVMPGIPEMISDVQVEGTFPDGTKLVTVHDPICSQEGNPELVLYGSGLTVALRKRPQVAVEKSKVIPGESDLDSKPVILNAGHDTLNLVVVNMGDRPVQVGSHYPFFETNSSLLFDRERAMGFRLDIPSGTAVRFEPGERKTVPMVALGGTREIYGGSGLIMGAVDKVDVKAIMEKAKQNGFQTKEVNS